MGKAVAVAIGSGNGVEVAVVADFPLEAQAVSIDNPIKVMCKIFGIVFMRAEKYYTPSNNTAILLSDVRVSKPVGEGSR